MSADKTKKRSYTLSDLTGKVAIVTGSAQGLGQGMAQGLAMAGADVVGVDVRSQQEATREAVESEERSFLSINADVAEKGSPERIVAAALETFHRIDILVNNAGILRLSPFLDFKEDDWDRVMDVNLRAVFLMSQAVARHLVARGTPGSIINIASMLSFQGSTKLASYTTSKTGILGLTRAMANELAKDAIRVNAIAPGYMETENTAALRKSPKGDVVLSLIPMARWGKPGDLQGPVVFLASAASAYVTGQTLVVDGGWLSCNV
jgi:2-deoxy-D-gluconate 3-dehydrogenase